MTRWTLLWYILHEDMIDHRSYIHNWSNCEIKAWEKNQAWTGLEAMTSAIPMPCSINWDVKPTGVGAGHIVSS